MKWKVLIPVLVLAAALAGAVVFSRKGGSPNVNAGRASRAVVPAPARRGQPAPPAEPVPAHYEAEPARGSLAPTLAPEQFTGLAREAYRVVREDPQLIAQMPCYCHCDEGFGHKSLQSCFVDDHAAHCDICVKEALAASQLKKTQRLSAPEIRERIIAQYGAHS